MKSQVTTAGRDRHEESVVRSESPAETERLGRELAGSLGVPAIVLLSGSLGSGKTTLARGFAVGLGIQDPAQVHSPSFTIVNVYRGKCPIYHVDLYRLAGKRDMRSVGLEDFVGREGVTIVEWGERLPYVGKVDMAVEIEDGGGELRILRITQSKDKAATGRARSRNRSSIRRHSRLHAGKTREPRRP